ncbi:MAG TPA: hypothetical protein VFV08_15180, partial [Puia sp.]|nr:hypothetical protein [Puia sp.]
MTKSPLAKKIIKITFRIIWITALTIIVILVTILILIQTPPVQNFARKKIVSYVQSKIHTRFEIGHLKIGFPKKIILENIYLEDLKKDTLLYAGKIETDISMFKLLHQEL